ncbi:MAG: cytochrome b/b6 domain-containing protein [Thiobacillaceae bacterium]
MAGKVLRSLFWCLATAYFLLAAPVSQGADTLSGQAGAAAVPKAIANKRCVMCHGDAENKTVKRPDGTEVNIFVDKSAFEHSAHGKQLCVGCHNNITSLPHPEPLPIRVGCIECHRQKWAEQQAHPTAEYKTLGMVNQQIDAYLHSVHAQPNKLDDTKVNATCIDCHDAHNIGPVGSEQSAERRLKNPEVCGRCHEKEKAEYLTSVHGRAVMEQKNAKAAVCSDCHTTHNIASPMLDATQLRITQNCGNCHKPMQQSYLASYHGQVERLGYTSTAKCFDCHGGHGIKKTNDPASRVNSNNLLQTCQSCHKDATANFVSFQPHGNSHDFHRYPGIWITTKFMEALIISVFLFFWTHVLLWFYREYKDRQAGLGYKPDPAKPATVYFRRFSVFWRLIHLLFALSIITLVLTGTTLQFANTAWAHAVIHLIGGPKMEAIIHRTAGVILLTAFMVQFAMVGFNIWRNRKTFTWFGPTSLVPSLQDLRDIAAMFHWFLGRAPRPSFDHWSYWQKFDYWAPFWGMAIIGGTGLLLFFPTITSIILPGWVFNIATIAHGEEALLAAVFLFTVHYFNVHFRPDKFPMSTSIFTGSVPLEEFKHDHALAYERLLATGELDKYLVKPPSARMAKGARLLTAVLIFASLTLLVLVLYGYATMSR